MVEREAVFPAIIVVTVVAQVREIYPLAACCAIGIDRGFFLFLKKICKELSDFLKDSHYRFGTTIRGNEGIEKQGLGQ
jgi:hypothetical protein